MGPTASGKTGLVVELFNQLPIELISVDSALVYQGMDIGTAKPDAETLRRAPHHLINLIPPTESYSAAQFRKDALGLMAEITSKGKIPVLVGGTMLYFKALQGGLAGLPEADQEVRATLDADAATMGWPAMHQRLTNIDPKTAARLQPTDAQRIQRALEVHVLSGKTMSELFDAQSSGEFPYELLKISLVPSDRSVLHQRIAQRFDLMLADGVLDEVKGLKLRYPTLHAETPSMRCVGYRQALQYLSGEDTATEFREKAIAATRQLAKRQLTWLRGMDDTTEIDCLKNDLNKEALIIINQFINH
ncbi:tRNA (adenosine(37)-N6)-dimethylallyltransferase MiaA [Methylovorus sp. MM2]|uniref:tRNA (adenosine(37)-N6)-dimethylallyltransferase MiaA n=1 Tax=Methylovorus sp. MM2 TaxID=1848038 RepID=UPI0007E26737|nr:tRNA (adenosine(37)-N6)-dimethylallyltransferase MiaA [Methylovorus sp. MM2]OAM53045.1 tRNA (adenosine(37)-N6)-dimethylallyltransferase MiaA [Methylovorus sp. MM2]